LSSDGDTLRFGPPTPPDRVALAQHAFVRGQSALAANDPAEAVRWLDRASRLLPDDPALMLALAGSCVGRDDARAAYLFATVAERWSVREAWLGLAAVRRALREPSAAAMALSRVLSLFAVTHGLEPLADSIAGDIAAPGWCGLAAGMAGAIIIRLTDPTGTADLRLDGQPLAPAGDGIDPPPSFPRKRESRTSPAAPLFCMDARLRGHDETPVGIKLQSGVHPLPRLSAGARRLEVLSDGKHLLGSPILISAIRRSEGFVTARDGGLSGWAWHPGDPDTDPVLTIRSAEGGRDLRVLATEPAFLPAAYGFTRARAFHVFPHQLPKAATTLHVLGSDGHELLGGPLDPGWEQRVAATAARIVAARFPAAPGSPPGQTSQELVAVRARLIGPRLNQRPIRRREADIVVPVHGAPDATRACLDSVLATVRAPTRVLVVDDASAEPELIAFLDDLAHRRRIRLIRHPTALGFPASANAGLRACRGKDVVLLNSDTLVPSRVAPGWLERLHQAAYQAPDIGTASPLSNSASILSYPRPAGENAVPGSAETARIDRLAHKANAARVVDIPVSVGFCMYIRRDCLAEVGLFRTDLFAQGYGEENDFCLRARHLGWRHVAAIGVFVAHVGGSSFGAAGHALQVRNQAVLNTIHPGYDRLIADWAATDPLTDPFRRLDLARWRAARRPTEKAVILITHADGGGVEHRVAESCRAHCTAGRRPIVLRPDRTARNRPGLVVSDGDAGAYPHLRYALPDELTALVRMLRAESPTAIELHHTLGHSPAIYDVITALALPYEVHVHDAVWMCPRVILVGPDRRYCGEPDAVTCDACVADAGSATEEPISVAALRQRSARLLSGARRVLVPSQDAATRLRRHFPELSPLVVFPEDDESLPPPDLSLGYGERIRVCVVGAIGVAKGYDVLLSCARDAARRELPLEFVVVGHTIDDNRLIATGRVFVTGEFRRHEAVSLIRSQHANVVLLPSIAPETWCYALTDAWRAGLRVLAFDIGAQAERIRCTGRGIVLPHGVSAAYINDALLATSS